MINLSKIYNGAVYISKLEASLKPTAVTILILFVHFRRHLHLHTKDK